MALSKKAREILIVAMANRAKANEIADKIDALESSSSSLAVDVAANTADIGTNAGDIADIVLALNTLLDELEARIVDDLPNSVPGFYTGLKI